MVAQNHPRKLDSASQVVLRVLEQVGHPIASTKLAQLVYLVDCAYYQHYGETLSGLTYRWGHYGPNALDHGIIGYADDLTKDKLLERETRVNSYGEPAHLYRCAEAASSGRLSDAGEMIIGDIAAQYGMLSVDEITKLSKETAPFENAKRNGQLPMAQSIPAIWSEKPDWSSHLSELEEQGAVSLEELAEGYGLG